MIRIQEWLSWPWKRWGRGKAVNAARIARAAIEQVGLPWKESAPGVWSAFAEPKHGYQVRLELFTNDEHIICMALAGVNVKRDWIPQKLAITLLEENNSYWYGSNRLLDGPDGMSVVHSHVCDSRRCDAALVAEIAEIVIWQMQKLVTRLYAEELILEPTQYTRTLELR